ncbi:NAD(P)-dependent oxidoreductase [Catenuloplanes japonicus]|uniref:NAD(P)-dependent oxidoreductase n=1 Tax=Catenuloplanes japonicus TaxID=33876 RepID=UPI00052544C9|nr:NAD(P)H-binding protein [Catenuloplanes japonicus]
MNVVVIGAAGRTGRLIVAEAGRAGHRVTAAVRTPGGFDGVREVRADASEEGGLNEALAGQDVVISAIGPAGRKAHGLYSGAARAIVAAAPRGRVIGITSSGVRADDPHFSAAYRWLVRPIVREQYADMAEMERIVGESAPDWTFVRPGRLLDTPATGAYRVGDGGTPAGGWQITRADLAAFIVAELTERRWSRRFPTIAH